MADLTPEQRRMRDSVLARVERGDERVPVYLSRRELAAAVVALMVMEDFVEYTRTGEMSPYLRTRFYDGGGPNDETVRAVIDTDLADAEAAFVRLSRAEKQHPANVEAKKHLRGEYDDEP